LLATRSNSALQLIKLIYVEKQSMAPVMVRLRTTAKLYGSVNSERDIPPSPTRHLSFSRVGHLSSVVCLGMGHLSPIYSNIANFTFLLQISAYFISFQEEGIAYSYQKRD